MWQEIIVGVCVLAAAYFVARQWLPIGKKKSVSCGSGSCGGCGASGSNSSGVAKSCVNPEIINNSKVHTE